MKRVLVHIRKKGIAGVFTCFVAILIISGIVSCGKGDNVIPVGANIQFQVVNLSPDLRPINLWVGFVKRNVAYSYPNPSGYFSLTSIDTPFQIRSAQANVSTANLVTVNTLLKPNTKYTLFVTGFRIDSTVSGIFTIDTAATTVPGRGKIRFVNASPRSANLDVMANGTMAFTNRAYKSVSNFLEMAPGTYELKVTPTGAATNVLKTTNVTVQDGKLYTLYSYGVAGRVDSAGFGLGVLPNR